MLAFLNQWRAAVIRLVALPLSLVVAILALRWTGSTVNTMVLAGFAIALGAVVDDAIIDIENIVRRMRENKRLGSPKSDGIGAALATTGSPPHCAPTSAIAV